ncbi:MAG: nucleotide exchange factor GrpE [Deltaproteobacteria bacterium HGW-Deltaproteobacteria-14]|nr:MAG: nucleotide exchange factor GrpE [Deltaproteobacteria bacterium HGW-Deltaproteobacteria-14]
MSPNDQSAPEVEVIPAETDAAGAAEGEAGADGAAAEETAAEEAAAQTPPHRPPPDPRELRIRFLEAQLAEKDQKLIEYIRAHKKAEQEFEAIRGRLQRDQDREILSAKGKVVEKMLDVDENLERTIEATSRGGSVESLLEGLRLVHRMFVERLTELGLERVDPIGQPFDPSTMQALGVVPVRDPAQADHVVMTMRAGFRLGDHEIRPALVQVGKIM